MSIITPQQLEMLLPLVCGWAVGQERAIVQSGVALSESQLADARRAGVAQPERVRLLRVAQIPVPTARALAAAARATNLINPLTHGLTSVMAFLFGQIVGINARSFYISLSTLYSMSALADSRVFCVRICWSALPHRVIRMGRWSRRLLLWQRNCAPNHALQRTAAGHRSCNRRVSWPPSLSMGRWMQLVAGTTN
jgi:hypothetical protein